MSYTKIDPDSPEVENFNGRFYKVRRALGTNAFGINEVRLPAGAEGFEHDETETGHEEVYVALDGSATFRIDGGDVELTAGEYLLVEPGSTRLVTAGADGFRMLVVGGKAKAEYDGRKSL